MGAGKTTEDTGSIVPTLEQDPLRLESLETAELSQGQPKALRLAFLLSRYPAVSHTFLLNEVLGLRARGVDVETASINRPDRAPSELSKAEASEAHATHYIKNGSRLVALARIVQTACVHPDALLRGLLTVARLRNLSLRQRGYWLFYLAEALLLGRWMQQRKLKHLHVHFGGAVASVGMLASVAWKIPYSLTIHGPEELLDVTAYQLKEKVEQASFVFCISDFCRSQLCQLTAPRSWSKFTVVRLGVDPAALLPSLDAGAPAQATVRLVCTGRLVAAKGHRILLQALVKLADRGVTVKATLIGDGPERASLRKFVEREGLEGSVVFTSALSHAETLQHVRAADIFVLASFAEGIPVALMEAMALGLPCVSTTVAGIPELIQTGRDGLLVAPSNVDELADAIESLTKDTALRNFLGRSARRRIIRDYNLPLNQERLAQCFQERLAQCFQERLAQCFQGRLAADARRLP
jgi:colanic acid/amylovoran biosynthesis glycosyltransferase